MIDALAVVGGIFLASIVLFITPPAIFGSFYWWRDLVRNRKRKLNGQS